MTQKDFEQMLEGVKDNLEYINKLTAKQKVLTAALTGFNQTKSNPSQNLRIIHIKR